MFAATLLSWLSPLPHSYSLILVIVVGGRLELFDLYKGSTIGRNSTLEHCQCRLIDYFPISDDIVPQLFFYHTFLFMIVSKLPGCQFA